MLKLVEYSKKYKVKEGNYTDKHYIKNKKEHQTNRLTLQHKETKKTRTIHQNLTEGRMVERLE